MFARTQLKLRKSHQQSKLLKTTGLLLLAATIGCRQYAAAQSTNSILSDGLLNGPFSQQSLSQTTDPALLNNPRYLRRNDSSNPQVNPIYACGAGQNPYGTSSQNGTNSSAYNGNQGSTYPYTGNTTGTQYANNGYNGNQGNTNQYGNGNQTGYNGNQGANYTNNQNGTISPYTTNTAYNPNTNMNGGTNPYTNTNNYTNNNSNNNYNYGGTTGNGMTGNNGCNGTVSPGCGNNNNGCTGTFQATIGGPAGLNGCTNVINDNNNNGCGCGSNNTTTQTNNSNNNNNSGNQNQGGDVANYTGNAATGGGGPSGNPCTPEQYNPCGTPIRPSGTTTNQGSASIQYLTPEPPTLRYGQSVQGVDPLQTIVPH